MKNNTQISDICITSTIYTEVIDRVKSIAKDVALTEDVSNWILATANFEMCFVGDNCPKRYRDDVLRIIKEVEAHYSK